MNEQSLVPIRIPLATNIGFAKPSEGTDNVPRISAPSSTVFQLDESLLHTHLAIFGGTRRGKSKLIEQICRCLVQARRGFAFIDPHSDTADDILAWLAAQNERLGIQRANIHYINPTEKLISIDPFYYSPELDRLEGHSEIAYREWLHARVLDVERMITRVLGETEAEAKKQVRMHRWMRSVLYAIGIRHDSTGKHFGLEEALALLNPEHPNYERVTTVVFPLLKHPDSLEVLQDLEDIGRIRDMSRRESFTESTIHRLREVLSPIVRRIFHPKAQRMDFQKIIESNGIILASLGKKTRMHQIDGHILGGMIIRQIADAVMVAEKERRNRFYLFIDEAQNFIGEDLERLYKESGKYKLSLGLAMQSIENLRSGEIDLMETVLGQSDFQVTFQQKFYDNALVLSQTLAHRLIDFTPLVHEVQKHDGYDFVLTESRGQTKTVGESRSESYSDTSGVSYTRTQGSSTSSGRSSTSTRHDHGTTSSETSSSSRGTNESTGQSDSHSSTSGTTQGHSVQTGTTITITQTPLAKYRAEKQATGSLVKSLDWQDRQIANAFQDLAPQHCFVSIDKLKIGAFMRIVDVFDPFEQRGVGEDWKRKVVDGFKKKHIYERHSYYFDREELLIEDTSDTDEPQYDTPFALE